MDDLGYVLTAVDHRRSNCRGSRGRKMLTSIIKMKFDSSSKITPGRLVKLIWRAETRRQPEKKAFFEKMKKAFMISSNFGQTILSVLTADKPCPSRYRKGAKVLAKGQKSWHFKNVSRQFGTRKPFQHFWQCQDFCPLGEDFLPPSPLYCPLFWGAIWAPKARR
jgi:hypothetical protein